MNANKQPEKWTRRSVLTTLGLTGIAMTSGVQPVLGKSRNATFITCATVADLVKANVKKGDVVQTLGYYEIGDGGDTWYRVGTSDSEPAGAAGVLTLANGLTATLLAVQSVNYRMFGAVCDGVADDGIAIQQAHTYANERGIPVVNSHGEFWIKETNGIVIQTPVTWGHTIFHIDERFNEKGRPKFLVKSSKKPQEVTWNAEQKAAFLKAFKPGARFLSELAPFHNGLVCIKDENDRIGYRAGASYKGQSWAREEFFYVEEHGRIIGDIAWEFTDYTHFTVYPCDDNYLVIDGGTFYLSGDNPGTEYNGYKSNGFSVSRSRTIIRNQWVGLEKGKADVAMTPRSGFYTFSMVYDVTLENVRLIPWEQDRAGKDRDVPAGTYGIGAARMLNGVFRNVTAEGGPIHWGVFGTNLNKNFRIEHCRLNRVDVHFHCWNLCITDSHIGYRGISITGGGDLLIQNTTCGSQSFVNFRRDFGSKWDGRIRVVNCRLEPPSASGSAVLSFRPADFDYKYPIGLAHAIHLEDLVIDYSGNPANDQPCWLIQTPQMSKTEAGEHLFFPRDLVVRNVSVIGREQGVRLMELVQPQHYRVDRKGGYDGVQLHTNARIIFEQVQLEDLSDPKAAHLVVLPDNEQPYDDAYALYPTISLTDCQGFVGKLSGCITEVKLTRTSVCRLQCNDRHELFGSLTFQDCTFQPVTTEERAPFYTLATSLGTNFINCILHAPLVGGQRRYDLLDDFGFIVMNKSLKFSHVNTRIGRGLINHYKEKGDGIRPEFIAKLKNHHELEPDELKD